MVEEQNLELFHVQAILQHGIERQFRHVCGILFHHRDNEPGKGSEKVKPQTAREAPLAGRKHQDLYDGLKGLEQLQRRLADLQRLQAPVRTCCLEKDVIKREEEAFLRHHVIAKEVERGPHVQLKLVDDARIGRILVTVLIDTELEKVLHQRLNEALQLLVLFEVIHSILIRHFAHIPKPPRKNMHGRQNLQGKQEVLLSVLYPSSHDDLLGLMMMGLGFHRNAWAGSIHSPFNKLEENLFLVKEKNF